MGPLALTQTPTLPSCVRPGFDPANFGTTHTLSKGYDSKNSLVLKTVTLLIK